MHASWGHILGWCQENETLVWGVSANSRVPLWDSVSSSLFTIRLSFPVLCSMDRSFSIKPEKLVIQKVDSQYTLYSMILVITHSFPCGAHRHLSFIVDIPCQNGGWKGNVY